MTAREMFEELGYKRNVEDNKITYSQKFGYETFEIMFDLSEKEINIDTDMEVKIEEDILQAIDKQAEELGWLEEEKQETNLQHYYDDLIKVGTCFGFANGKIEHCYDKGCNKCIFDNKDCGRESIKWLSQPYKKLTYKLNQFEYDLLHVKDNALHNRKLSDFITYKKLKELGYFKDIDFDLTIDEVLTNCEVIK